jgi:glycosyltransferase 2 family protein
LSILSRCRGVLRTVAWLGFGTIVAIAVVSAVRDGGTRAAIAQMSRPETIPWLIAAVGANLMGFVVGMVAWRTLMAGMGSRLDLLTSSHIVAISLLGKLIPGPMWGVLAEVDLARKAGVPPARKVTHTLLFLAIIVLTGGAMGCVAAFSVLGARAAWFAILLTVPLGVLVRPALIGHGVKWAAARLRRPITAEQPSSRSVRLSSLIQMGAWSIAGLHLWAIAVALGAAPLPALLVCVGTFAFASVAGAAVIFLPDGLGVREVIIVVALSSLLPLSSAEIGAVVSRLCCLAAELGAAGSTILIQIARTSTKSEVAQ